ncbi:MAG: hypothetical protein GDA48_13730 [Hormoscilla sp. GM102CHS1]|nr:hypothetical protein [Hormoscilla sp. GM102CHS1]
MLGNYLKSAIATLPSWRVRRNWELGSMKSNEVSVVRYIVAHRVWLSAIALQQAGAALLAGFPK